MFNVNFTLDVLSFSGPKGYKRSLLGVWYCEGEWFVDLFWVRVYSGSKWM